MGESFARRGASVHQVARGLRAGRLLRRRRRAWVPMSSSKPSSPALNAVRSSPIFYVL